MNNMTASVGLGSSKFDLVQTVSNRSEDSLVTIINRYKKKKKDYGTTFCDLISSAGKGNLQQVEFVL